MADWVAPCLRADKALYTVICRAGIDEAVNEFQCRRVDHSWFPHLVLDAT